MRETGVTVQACARKRAGELCVRRARAGQRRRRRLALMLRPTASVRRLPGSGGRARRSAAVGGNIINCIVIRRMAVLIRSSGFLLRLKFHIDIYIFFCEISNTRGVWLPHPYPTPGVRNRLALVSDPSGTFPTVRTNRPYFFFDEF